MRNHDKPSLIIPIKHGRYVFIDGRRYVQVEWAAEQTLRAIEMVLSDLGMPALKPILAAAE